MLEVLVSMLGPSVHSADAMHLDSCPICARRAAEEDDVDTQDVAAATYSVRESLLRAMRNMQLRSRVLVGGALVIGIGAVVVTLLFGGTADRVFGVPSAGIVPATSYDAQKAGPAGTTSTHRCVLVLPGVPAWNRRSAVLAGYRDSFRPLLPGSAAGIACRATANAA